MKQKEAARFTMVKVVIVCTSAPELKGHPTGLWLEELAGPYYVFQEKGCKCVYMMEGTSMSCRVVSCHSRLVLNDSAQP